MVDIIPVIKRHLLHAGVVDEAGVGAGSCYDEFGSEEAGRLLQLVIIYQTCFGLRRCRRRFTHNRNTSV